jgi:hypothetical protein
MNLNSDFKQLLSILNEAQGRYLIVGGYAVIEHTEPRYTKDLDLRTSPEKEKRWARVFGESKTSSWVTGARQYNTGRSTRTGIGAS